MAFLDPDSESEPLGAGPIESGKIRINKSCSKSTCDGGALHLSLVVDNDPGTVLKVDEGPVFSPECLPLSTKR